jgi:hypothetical protein
MDGARRLTNDTIEYRRHAREMDISIPMAALGHPDVILTSARTLAGMVSLDLASWHIIEIKRAPDAAPVKNSAVP